MWGHNTQENLQVFNLHSTHNESTWHCCSLLEFKKNINPSIALIGWNTLIISQSTRCVWFVYWQSSWLVGFVELCFYLRGRSRCSRVCWPAQDTWVRTWYCDVWWWADWCCVDCRDRPTHPPPADTFTWLYSLKNAEAILSTFPQKCVHFSV